MICLGTNINIFCSEFNSIKSSKKKCSKHGITIVSKKNEKVCNGWGILIIQFVELYQLPIKHVKQTYHLL